MITRGILLGDLGPPHLRPARDGLGARAEIPGVGRRGKGVILSPIPVPRNIQLAAPGAYFRLPRSLAHTRGFISPHDIRLNRIGARSSLGTRGIIYGAFAASVSRPSREISSPRTCHFATTLATFELCA